MTCKDLLMFELGSSPIVNQRSEVGCGTFPQNNKEKEGKEEGVEDLRKLDFSCRPPSRGKIFGFNGRDRSVPGPRVVAALVPVSTAGAPASPVVTATTAAATVVATAVPTTVVTALVATSSSVVVARLTTVVVYGHMARCRSAGRLRVFDYGRSFRLTTRGSLVPVPVIVAASSATTVTVVV